MTTTYDLFLSHATGDKPWVKTLADELEHLKLKPYLDIRELPNEPRGFVIGLGEGLDRSACLVLILSQNSHQRPWVVKEVSEFMAEHGPFSVLNVLLDEVPLPTMNRTPQQIDAKDRDAKRVAAEIAKRLGRLRELPVELLCRNDLAFAFVGNDLVDPAGKREALVVPNELPQWLKQFGRWAGRYRKPEDRAELHQVAGQLGKALFEVLFSGDRRSFYEAATRPGRARPTLRIVGQGEASGWPWELLHDGRSYLVETGRLDVVRTTDKPLELSVVAPRDKFKVLLNVSAPVDEVGLRYEEEQYRIVQAIAERCELVVSELGEFDDMLGVAKEHNPAVVHFSGHGSRGALSFENELGGSRRVRTEELIEGFRKEMPGGRLPELFVLSCCHGDDGAGDESLAGRVHRAGVRSVLAYRGPIADDLATRAEEALYGKLSGGWSVGEAVREMRNALIDEERPYAWTQLSFHQAGLDGPLQGIKSETKTIKQDPQQTFADPMTRRQLREGFIGRRVDLHRLRRLIKEGRRVMVLQGLGGLGKSTLSQRVPRLLGMTGEVIWCQDTENHDDSAWELVRQLEGVAERQYGESWAGIRQQLDQATVGKTLLRAKQVLSMLKPVVLILDNLESLLQGPREGEFAAWRTEELGELWKMLRAYAEHGGKMYLIGSTRYINDDLDDRIVAVTPLPKDAMYRLLDWLPTIRKLKPETRGRLVECLEGHPRAAMFAEDLIRGKKRVKREVVSEEWERYVAPALPELRKKLTADLLLGELWENVLDEAQREMMWRMTLIRTTWDDELCEVLGREETLESLRRTSLLEWDEDGENQRYYKLHPATAQYVREQGDKYETTRRETHERIGTHLEQKAKTSRYIEVDIEAGYHLYQAAEYNRAYELLGSASDMLRNWGQSTQALALLKPFLEPAARDGLSAERRGQMLGTLGLACYVLSQVEKAIEYHLQALKVYREIKDRRGEGATLGNLGLAYAALGQTEKAIEYYLQRLEIAREIKDRRGEGNALGNLGVAYKNLGQTEKAIEYHLQYLEISREIKDRRGEGIVLFNLALSYEKQGRTAEALAHAETALAIGQEIKDARAVPNRVALVQRLRAARGA